MHGAVCGSGAGWAQVGPVMSVFWLGTVVGLKSIRVFLAGIINKHKVV